ncbi:MAG TPA: DNA-binding transcriptional regulator [Verrucomicrobiae bacterium]|nr:DNA-binding transcriptional regulator [Verrucomicrobiae bacterium]
MKKPLKKIPLIGLFIESSRSSGRALLTGIVKHAQHYGPWSFYWEPGGLEKAWPKLQTLDIDGIILRDVDKLEEVLALKIPAIVVGHSKTEIPGLVNVVTDSMAIGKIGAEHLLSRGLKHFAYCGYGSAPSPVSNTESFVWSEGRQNSFQQHIERAGFRVDAFCTLHGATDVWQQERQKLTNWLQSLPKPVGVMACNDDCGQQVVEACKLAGLSIPDEVSVLGADNDELICGLSSPAMSSVAINFERAGYEAARVLNDLLRGKKTEQSKITVTATHVVVRRSTDYMAISDLNLQKALQFIRDHIRENIRVLDVSRAAGLSRRALEIKFQREMESSVHDYIKRLRTDQIMRLLVETDLPIGQIAESLGFSDIQHFARYFRAGTQMSPLAYRRNFGK